MPTSAAQEACFSVCRETKMTWNKEDESQNKSFGGHSPLCSYCLPSDFGSTFLCFIRPSIRFHVTNYLLKEIKTVTTKTNQKKNHIWARNSLILWKVLTYTDIPDSLLYGSFRLNISNRKGASVLRFCSETTCSAVFLLCENRIPHSFPRSLVINCQDIGDGHSGHGLSYQ